MSVELIFASYFILKLYTSFLKDPLSLSLDKERPEVKGTIGFNGALFVRHNVVLTVDIH